MDMYKLKSRYTNWDRKCSMLCNCKDEGNMIRPFSYAQHVCRIKILVYIFSTEKSALYVGFLITSTIEPFPILFVQLFYVTRSPNFIIIHSSYLYLSHTSTLLFFRLPSPCSCTGASQFLAFPWHQIFFARQANFSNIVTSASSQGFQPKRGFENTQFSQRDLQFE